MYVPTAPAQLFPRLPRALLLGAALLVAVVLWAVLSLGIAGNESHDPQTFPEVDPSAVGALTFLESGPAEASLVLRDASAPAAGRTVAAFERINDGEVHGVVSPDAAHAAVVHPAPHSGAYLSIVDLSSGARTTSPAMVDSDTALAWATDGSSVVAVTSTAADPTGRLGASLLRMDTATGQTTTLATFPSVLRAVPVGFAPDGETVLVVVIDQAGSALWSVAGPEPRLIASLSGGRTSDWVLSPDGSMLAFVELRSGADVPAVGHVVFTATGQPASDFEQLAAYDGAVWKPGSTVAGFGGPGGNLELTVPQGDYLVPAGWSPDGSSLVAQVVEPSPDGQVSSVSWQLVPDSSTGTEASRTIVFEEADGVSFLGWARTSLLFPPATPSSTGADIWP